MDISNEENKASWAHELRGKLGGKQAVHHSMLLLGGCNATAPDASISIPLWLRNQAERNLAKLIVS